MGIDRVRILTVARDPSWQFIGVVVAVIFGLITFGFAGTGGDAADDPPVSGTISGDCNAIGRDVAVDC
jgi:hypothetical protein